jgi:hypothetical protein
VIDQGVPKVALHHFLDPDEILNIGRLIEPQIMADALNIIGMHIGRDERQHRISRSQLDHGKAHNRYEKQHRQCLQQPSDDELSHTQLLPALNRQKNKLENQLIFLPCLFFRADYFW